MSQREMPVRKPAIASPYHIVLKCLSHEPRSRIRRQIAEGFRHRPPCNPFRRRIASRAAPRGAGRKIRSQPGHPSCPPSPRRLACAPEKPAGATDWLKSGSTRLVRIRSARRRRSRCRSHGQGGGRSRVAALTQINATAASYSNLEYDIARGERGKRDVHTGRLLAELVGAEAAIVVNNNAAAVFIVLLALAQGAEVIVSRGELIEIGDGFRIPDIMNESGALLREVGTTNRTRLRDYERAITDRTRLLLRVHPSNFRITGFTERPPLAELVALGERFHLPVYEDLGAGCIADLAANGIAEPVARASCDAGASVITFSGDKLLGGPQAGIVAGKKEFVERIR